MTEPLQLTVGGAEEPIAAPLAPSGHEQDRLFTHAPTMRGQIALDTDAQIAMGEAAGRTDWPRCTWCGELAAEVLRHWESGEGVGPDHAMDACRACEPRAEYWDEPGAEIITREDQQ
jgi:hypothetical protein